MKLQMNQCHGNFQELNNMRFSYTHHMPYTDIEKAGQDWPVSNKQLDPNKSPRAQQKTNLSKRDPN